MPIYFGPVCIDDETGGYRCAIPLSVAQVTELVQREIAADPDGARVAMFQAWLDQPVKTWMGELI